MNYPQPTENEYTVYSKSNCKYCVYTKELLNDVKTTIINCDEFLDNKEDFFQFIRKINGDINHRTFPIVFYNKNFIGGFTETEKFYNINNLDENF